MGAILASVGLAVVSMTTVSTLMVSVEMVSMEMVSLEMVVEGYQLKRFDHQETVGVVWRTVFCAEVLRSRALSDWIVQ